MEWKPLSPEEAKGLQFSSKTGKESPYKAILDATDNGPVKVSMSGEQSLQSLKWALSSQIKKAGLPIVMATLADKTGVVLTREATEPPKK